MSSASDKVQVAKRELEVGLGPNAAKYFANMKFWFRHKWSKEEFDMESRKLLAPDKMHLHNQFLIAILNKIDIFQAPLQSATVSKQSTSKHSSSIRSTLGQHSSNTHASSHKTSRKRKRSRLSADKLSFEPFDLFEFLRDDSMHIIRPPAGVAVQQLPTQRYSVQELFLPEAGFVLGRFLIGAWEVGITHVDDKVAEYVAIAVQELLKNLISALIMKRKHYKVTGEGSFYYDIGTPLCDPSLRNTVTRQKIDDSPLDRDKEITAPNFGRRTNEDATFLAGCEEVYDQKYVITLRDAQRAFSDRNLIASHSVYSMNMERLTQMMH